MKIGMVLPMTGSDGPGADRWPRIRHLAQHAEAGGIDSLWVYDHLIFRMPGEEALAIIGPLPRGGRVTLHGRWHDVEDAVLVPPSPRPTRLPGRIPLLIAAKGERVLRLTAGHADAWNTAWYGLPDDRSRGGSRTCGRPARPRGVIPRRWR